MTMNSKPGRRSVLGAFAAAAAVPAVGAWGAAAAPQRPAGPAPAVDAPAERKSATGPNVIMFIRHAEKPTDSGAPYGVTDHGKKDTESLTVQGWTRAGALVSLFAPRTATGDPAPVRAGLTRPVGVFAADPTTGGSRRPAETISVVAAALGVTPVEQYAKGDEASLATALLAAAGPQLVAWEHKKIPDILAGLGPITPAPPASWSGDRFDVVWVLTANGAGWTFSQVPQMLLSGDSPDPIS